ncbi:MAG: TIGR00374 family protein, partial [Candidatus Latescibacterota bacterium]|nr:TIGR00374 family protein [Candidatus Latescibacterota bacterium]
MNSLVKKFYLSIGLGAAVFLAFSVYLDSGLLFKTIGRFDLLAGLIALALAVLNYLVRFWRWQLYLQQLEIPIPPLG